MKKQVTIHLVLLIFLSRTGIGQIHQSNHSDEQIPFVLGSIVQIQSAQLGETRTLNIFLPDGYSQDSSVTYPVIYLLDGSANEDFVHIVGIVQFLTMIKEMPNSIVIGIANVDRRRDFTFPTTIEQDKKDYPTTGGSANFMSFIQDELQPFVQKKFKTSGSKTLIGQSLGGLFATEVLFKKPNLFDHYIIVSPSLWWDKESLLLLGKSLSKQPESENISVYISVGAEGKQMEGDANSLVEILKNSGKTNLKVDFVPLANENHLTILHNSVYKAFQDFNPKTK
jgi:predicted alpha/beta superfamily hydrolase